MLELEQEHINGEYSSSIKLIDNILTKEKKFLVLVVLHVLFFSPEN